MSHFRFAFFTGAMLFAALVFFQCKKDSIQELPAVTDKMETFQLIDPNGKTVSVSLSGSTLIYDTEGEKRVYDLDEYTTNNDAVSLRAPVNKISGHLEVDQPYRGKINVNYRNGSGKVVWKHPDNSKTWGDIVCVNQVGDETTFEFVVTKTKPEGPVGGHLTMTVKDLGNGNSCNGQPNDQWGRATFLDTPCNSPVIQLVNGVAGFDEADGNIKVDYD